MSTRGGQGDTPEAPSTMARPCSQCVTTHSVALQAGFPPCSQQENTSGQALPAPHLLPIPSKPCSIPSQGQELPQPFPGTAGSRQEPGNGIPECLVRLCWRMMAATHSLRVVGDISAGSTSRERVTPKPTVM